MSQGRTAFVRFGWCALGLTVLVIVWGAVVRATGSGAGCGSHWPLCNGDVVPLAPTASTVIEFVHRLTSGGAMIVSLILVVAARRVFPAGHRARVWAVAALGFMLIEAAIGAGIVLLGLVEDNASVARAAYIAVHLTNTMLLLGAMTGTIWWAMRPDAPTVGPAQGGRGVVVSLIGLLVVAATGAIVALGDTLFPHASLSAGLAADLNPASHFLIRLRVLHPILAVGVALVILAQTRRNPTFRGDGAESRRTLVITLVVAQVGLGVMNLLMLAPLPLQMAHLVGSNLLWIALVWSWLEGRRAVETRAEQFDEVGPRTARV